MFCDLKEGSRKILKLAEEVFLYVVWIIQEIIDDRKERGLFNKEVLCD